MYIYNMNKKHMKTIQLQLNCLLLKYINAENSFLH